MKAALCILALCLSSVALADTVAVNWTNPTANTDETVIPASGPGSLSSARIEYGTCVAGAFGVKAGEVSRTMPASTVVLNLQPGQTCIQVKVSNTYGQESAASNVATRVVLPPTPKAPTNVQAP